MKILYFDCFAGISGDMTLGALVDLGADREAILKALRSLPVQGWELGWERVTRNGLAATRATVGTSEHHHHRGLSKIAEIINAGELPGRARGLAVRAFTLLAEAEAEAHGCELEKVHFHEVGAVDAIIDIVGSAVALAELAPEQCIGSPVRVGHGTVECAHGQYPIPAPGTAAILRNGSVPLFAGEHEGEWTTPTGAAILTAACSGYGPLPPMTVEATGFGAGGREHDRLPNLLRLMLGDGPGGGAGEVTVMEAEVDDMSPQLFGRLFELLEESRALDWFVTPVQMKKSRPGHLLTIVCREPERETLADLVFRETTTIGYRFYRAGREELLRRSVTVQTPFGPIGIKIAERGGAPTNAMPEYADCLEAARRSGRPLKTVRDAATRAYLEQLGGGGQV